MGNDHTTPSQILGAPLGGGRGSQGGAQQGTGARGEQDLDGPDRSHTLAPCGFGLGPQHPATKNHNTKTSLGNCPFFRSKRTLSPPSPLGLLPFSPSLSTSLLDYLSTLLLAYSY